MSNNVNVGGVPTKTLDSGGFHVQYYLLLGPDTPTVAAVAASATVITVAAAVTGVVVRRRLILVNDTNAFFYGKYGSGASLSLYSIAIAPQGAWEMPDPVDSGIFTGIWGDPGGGVTLAGNLMVTELKSTGA
jgi:hypothetical protein